MAWISTVRDLPVRQVVRQVLMPATANVRPHLDQLEHLFDVEIACGAQEEILLAEEIGKTAKGKPKVAIVPIGDAYISGIYPLPLVNHDGVRVPYFRRNTEDEDGTPLTVIEIASARYYLRRNPAPR